MTQAQLARTFGDLAALTTDLPAVPSQPRPSSTSALAPQQEHGWRGVWWSWLSVSVIVNVAWGATWLSDPSQVPYYWPFWVMVPGGAVMAVGWLSNKGKREQG